MFIKQSTAYTFRLGPFLDETDGKTAETGLTISQADVRLSKGGGNFAQKNESSSSSHDEIGYYICVLDTTDTNTCGELLVAVHESGALPVFKTFQVVEEAIYDALFAASAAAFDANQRVDVSKIEGSDATDQINAACDTALSDYDAPTKAEMDTAFSTTNGKVDTVDTVVDAILVDTAVIGSAGAGLTAVPWNSAWDAEVQSECNDALVALGLDHLVSASVAGSDVTDNSIVAKLVSKESTADWDDFANTTDSLQAIRDRGDASWATGSGGTTPHLMQNTTIASLASQTSFTLTAGSADDDAYNDCVIVITDQSTGVQKAHGTISDYTGSSKTVTLGADPGIFTMAAGDTVDIMSPLGAAGSSPSAAAIADAVWDEATSGHTSSGTFGAGVNVITIEGVDATDAIQTSASASLIAYNLDHLMKTPVASNADMTTEIPDGTVLSNLMTKTGDTSDYAYATDSLEGLADVWTTALTESYASDGAAATPAQLLYMIYCAVGEFSISGTTITGKKVDGSTTAMTWTINSESDPTSRTRAS